MDFSGFLRISIFIRISKDFYGFLRILMDSYYYGGSSSQSIASPWKYYRTRQPLLLPPLRNHQSSGRVQPIANFNLSFSLFLYSSVSFGATSIDSSVLLATTSIDGSVWFGDTSMDSSVSFEATSIDGSVLSAGCWLTEGQASSSSSSS